MAEFWASKNFFSRSCPPRDAQNTLLSLCVGPTASSGCRIESGRGQQISSVKVQIANVLGFAGPPISVTSARLCPYSRKAARDSA